MSISPDRYQTGRRLGVHEIEAECCVILVIDDDAAMRSLLVDELSECGCRVLQASDGIDAFAQLKVSTPNVVITDLNMKFGGFEFIRNLKNAIPDCPIIVVTAFGDARTKAMTKDFGVAGYFDKPVRMTDLRSLVMRVCPFSQCQHSQIAHP